jgi:hypothetical protein
MTARNLQLTSHLSQLSESLQTPAQRPSAPLQGDLQLQSGHASDPVTKHNQALQDLRQTYFLERRCFL